MSPSSSREALVVLTTLTLGFLLTLTSSMPVEQYDQARSAFLEKDRSTQLGYNLRLTLDESLVSHRMVQDKTRLIEAERVGGGEYLPAVSYFRSKPVVENTFLYNIFQKMPKGAALHLHDLAMTSLDWVVKNATYREHIYMCVNKNTYLMEFVFHKETPEETDECTWLSVAEERKAAASVSDFDESIKQNISLLSTDPLVNYPSVNEVWVRFQNYFTQVINIIYYEPVFRDYYRQGLEEFYADNVQYIELRSMFEGFYDIDGTVYSKEKTFEIYREVTEEFKKSHPDFIGVKYILASFRNVPPEDLLKSVKETMDMRKAHPDSVLGFDLVGQEDPNHPLLYYKDQLLYPSQTDPENPLPYFFHVAETNWQGTPTDYNLIDAVLLNTSRIGHGFGLVKHPSIVKEAKAKGIAVEVNPISNQLLGLMTDMRNHALVPLMADDFPVVVSSDDPGTWEADPLSSDFYMAFMNMCGEDADLRFLKQLAINSFKYSAMNEEEKDKAMELWQGKWDAFIQQTLNMIKKEKAKNGAQGSRFYKIVTCSATLQKQVYVSFGHMGFKASKEEYICMFICSKWVAESLEIWRVGGFIGFLFGRLSQLAMPLVHGICFIAASFAIP